MQQIKAHPVYQQVVGDAFGGIMYNVANRAKYDSTEIIALWNSLSPVERESADGIMKGAFNFLQGN